MTRLIIAKRSLKLGGLDDPRRLFANVPKRDKRTDGIVRLNGEEAQTLAGAYRLAAGKYPVSCQVVTAGGKLVPYKVCDDDADIRRYAEGYVLGRIVVRSNPTGSSER